MNSPLPACRCRDVPRVLRCRAWGNTPTSAQAWGLGHPSPRAPTSPPPSNGGTCHVGSRSWSTAACSAPHAATALQFSMGSENQLTLGRDTLLRATAEKLRAAGCWDAPAPSTHRMGGDVTPAASIAPSPCTLPIHRRVGAASAGPRKAWGLGRSPQFILRTGQLCARAPHHPAPLSCPPIPAPHSHHTAHSSAAAPPSQPAAPTPG